jgi:excisionase family DNA binding protein
MMLTVPQAAKRVGRDPETVRRWIRAGKLASSKVGTQHLIAEADLARMVGDTSVGVHPQGHRASEVLAPYAIDTGSPADRPPVGDTWLPAIVGRIVRLVDPVRIILFGSRARGDAREDSDYDVLVILDAVEHRRNTRIAIARELADLPVAADVVAGTPNDIAADRRGPRGIVQWAAEHGRSIYERT